MIQKSAKIYIAGHNGLIGSAVLRHYLTLGYTNILVASRKEHDLSSLNMVEKFFLKQKPEYVILAAARVGGIRANMEYPTEFMYENLMIQNHLIMTSLKNDVKKLLYISCGCAYPTKSSQPMKESAILTGPVEPTNEGFAIAKIAGMKLCEKINQQYKRSFISCIPANTYGEFDHFEEFNSHVIPSLIMKFHNAKIKNISSVVLWGTGKARREFIYVDDIARAINLLMNTYRSPETINIGSGEDITIFDLARMVKKIIGYKGKIMFDTSKPDGMIRRILDSSKIQSLGFRSNLYLEQGIKKSYEFYLKKI